jgi:hypothetical protein
MEKQILAPIQIQKLDLGFSQTLCQGNYSQTTVEL